MLLDIVGHIFDFAIKFILVGSMTITSIFSFIVVIALTLVSSIIIVVIVLPLFLVFAIILCVFERLKKVFNYENT